jgi:hypothetical protein
MLSKITIGLAPDKNACIKVLERKSDDVRDELIQSFREKLGNNSNTLCLTFLNSNDKEENNYIIAPVESERYYFLERLNSMFPYHERITELKEFINDVQKIIDRIEEHKRIIQE